MKRERVHENGPIVLTENGYQFFLDRHTPRIRWARIHWPDDGTGGSAYGAEYSLDKARKAARQHELNQNS